MEFCPGKIANCPRVTAVIATVFEAGDYVGIYSVRRLVNIKGLVPASYGAVAEMSPERSLDLVAKFRKGIARIGNLCSTVINTVRVIDEERIHAADANVYVAVEPDIRAIAIRALWENLDAVTSKLSTRGNRVSDHALRVFASLLFGAARPGCPASNRRFPIPRHSSSDSVECSPTHAFTTMSVTADERSSPDDFVALEL
jgi:hypothetical protein